MLVLRSHTAGYSNGAAYTERLSSFVLSPHLRHMYFHAAMYSHGEPFRLCLKPVILRTVENAKVSVPVVPLLIHVENI